MYSANLSIDPSGLRDLTTEQQQRLVSVLDQYLSALDAGIPPHAESLIASHPDLADALRAYLLELDRLHDMAAGFCPAPSGIESADALLPGGGESQIQLGDFVLGREIGRGGMGVVYEARQLSLQRRVAVKVLPFASVLDAKQIARFHNEAQAAAQLHHPHIVPIFAVGSARGVHYYAMQLIEGQPLDRVVDELRGSIDRLWTIRNSRMPVRAGTRMKRAAAGTQSYLLKNSGDGPSYFRAVAQLGMQAADALHAAHECGIVHRDIKPSNLLLESEGKLWITDFGLARFRSDGTLTQSGDMVGTMRYMSPEQAAGHSVLVDHRTDIYSLAATLYELLALQPAIAGTTAAQLLRAIDQLEPPRLTRIRPDIPRDLETVVRKAMSKTREDRYQSAQELGDDLRRVLAGEPTHARPPSLADRLSRWMLSRRRLVASAACLCLLMGTCGAAAAIVVMRESRESERSLQRAERNFHAAREVVDRFGAGLAERLADVPGAASAPGFARRDNRVLSGFRGAGQR